jgi:hypothetical protein
LILKLDFERQSIGMSLMNLGGDHF